jgi:hypothetical protein
MVMCQTEQEGICRGTFLILIFRGLGSLLSIQKDCKRRAFNSFIMIIPSISPIRRFFSSYVKSLHPPVQEPGTASLVKVCHICIS